MTALTWSVAEPREEEPRSILASYLQDAPPPASRHALMLRRGTGMENWAIHMQDFPTLPAKRAETRRAKQQT